MSLPPVGGAPRASPTWLKWAVLGCRAGWQGRDTPAPSLALDSEQKGPASRRERKGPGGGRGCQGPSASPGLLTSVCLLLAFFFESFRPVLFRSLQGSQRGQRLGTPCVLTRVCCEWALAGYPHTSATPGDQETRVPASRRGPGGGCVPSGGQHRNHTQWYPVRGSPGD